VRWNADGTALATVGEDGALKAGRGNLGFRVRLKGLGFRV
jgi:hypothetical protein